METESILLAKTAYGEDTQRLLFLCARSGFFAAFKKSSKRLTGKAQPDLFDTATVLFEEVRKNKVLFLKSYDTKVRREKSSKQYQRCEIACRLARLIIKNGAYLEDALQTFRLTEVALDAFNNLNAPPPFIYLKFLYLLLRQEGFPVRQSWRQNLHQRNAEILAPILQLPTEDLYEHSISHGQELILDLEKWARSETSLQIPS